MKVHLIGSCCPSTSLHRPPLPPPPTPHLPPLKQLCCFGPALKAVLITGTERRSEWQAGSILLKPNERNLCRVCSLQRPEKAVAQPIVLLLLSSLLCRLFYSYRIASLSPSLNRASLPSPRRLSCHCPCFSFITCLCLLSVRCLTLHFLVSLYLRLHLLMTSILYICSAAPKQRSRGLISKTGLKRPL